MTKAAPTLICCLLLIAIPRAAPAHGQVPGDARPAAAPFHPEAVGDLSARVAGPDSTDDGPARVAAPDPAHGAGLQESGAGLMPLLDGIGDHHHAVTTDVPMAQAYFDQGLTLHYAFNHAAALRSFREAARLDPDCAMCHWGQALTLGPNINDAMVPADLPVAREALERARRLRDRVSPAERAYIDALSVRYEPTGSEEDLVRDSAYAEAMEGVADRFPDDTDAAALLAEALMCTTPWDYWTEEGAPRPVTEKVLAALEPAMERDPDNPGPNHFYIHTVEAVQPRRGIPAAERIGDLVPVAGHLVHMPSHIWIRVGRYHDAVAANRAAVRADEELARQAEIEGTYRLGYVPHNFHFLALSAAKAGAGHEAMSAARDLRDHVLTERMRDPGLETLQHYWSIPLYMMVRFGRWEAALDEPAPAEDLVYPRGVRRFARGMARLRTGAVDEAARELEALEALAADPRLEGVTIWDLNDTRDLLLIARDLVSGELAVARGDVEEGLAHLREGVRREDALAYDEPPPWFPPVRHFLGAALLEAGRPRAAAEVYRADLERFPDNGWSLYGLQRSLEALGESEEARQVGRLFEEAWRHADIELTASRF